MTTSHYRLPCSAPLFCALGVLGLAAQANGVVRYVKAGLTTGADNGTSWANAYRGVDALSRAMMAAPGDEIWVAAGVYKPTLTGARDASFALRAGVDVYGGFAGVESARDERDFRANICILSGDLASNDPVVTDNCYHVVTCDDRWHRGSLDGFTITGGNADGAAGNYRDKGGGIFLAIVDVATIRNCIVTGNRCTSSGAGAYIGSASMSTFSDVTCEANEAGASGGGAEVYYSPAYFTRCTFVGNSAPRGGGVGVSGQSITSLVSCVIRGNNAGVSGGGLYMTPTSSQLTLRHCTIAGNTTTGFGSGVHAAGGQTRLFNSIVYFNTGPGGSTDGQLVAGPLVAVSYSCIQNGFAGAGNIGANPVFVGGPADLRLAAGSPCIDAARNSDSGAGNRDIALLPRFVDDPGTVDTGVGTPPIGDMGANEFQPPPLVCAPDWNGDGRLDSQDVFDFLAAFFHGCP